MEPYVKSVIKDEIFYINFFHPKGNSLTAKLLDDLTKNINSAPAEAKAIVLHSEGDSSFCGGASFDELIDIKNEEQAHNFFMGFGEVIFSIINSPKPVTALVKGKAIGGGVGIIAACDVALAYENASIKLSELAIGIGPYVVGPVIKDKIGLSAFQELSLSTEWKDAYWGQQKGLFKSVSNSDNDLNEKLEFWNNKFRSYPINATTAFKATMRNEYSFSPEILKERAKISGKLVLTPEAQALITAFLDKRK